MLFVFIFSYYIICILLNTIEFRLLSFPQKTNGVHAMRGINKVIIIGNLGADPEARQFQNGGSVTSISIATSEQWTDKQTGEKKEATEWHRVSLFNRLGEIAAQFLRKGSKVYIEGSLRTRKYTDPQGQERYITEIRAEQMQMLDSQSNSGQGSTYDQNSQNQNSNVTYAKNSPSNNNQSNYPQPDAPAFNQSSPPPSHSTPPLPDEDDLPF